MVASAARIFGSLRMRQLGLLIALDQHRSLRRAAADLSMTQSAASKALAEIEAIVGTPLFSRSRTGIVPNAMGHCIVRYAWLLRADVEAMCEEMDSIQFGRTGRLSVGAIMGAVPQLLADAILSMRQAEPGVSIHILEDTSARLLEALDQGHLDVVIGRATVSDDPALYRYEPLWDEPLCLAVGAGHALARRKSVSLQDLEPYGWIVYPSRMPLRVLLERAISEAGMIMPANVIETSSTVMTVSLLSRDPGLVALLPTDVCAFFAPGRVLHVLPLRLASGNPPYGIVTRTGGPPTAIARKFVDILKARVHVPAQGADERERDRHAPPVQPRTIQEGVEEP